MSKRGNKTMKKAKVYFTEKITPEAVIRMYQMLGKGTAGKGCGKGSLPEERGNQNYLRPAFLKPMVEGG